MNLTVIGFGYVGLPITVEFANAGFKVVGIDVDEVTVNKINYPGPGLGEHCIPINPHYLS